MMILFSSIAPGHHSRKEVALERKLFEANGIGRIQTPKDQFVPSRTKNLYMGKQVEL